MKRERLTPPKSSPYQVEGGVEVHKSNRLAISLKLSEKRIIKIHPTDYQPLLNKPGRYVR